ncbi:MAG TPA: cytochrome ubiquinol oxidase subunit I [Caulobacteraceae bacterium]|nr:cytochrome ubiquinol oxidase subunit I [Caulobacteraceae bacterium]
MHFDAIILARLQFAFTVAWHIIFPSFTIGLASYLAVLEGLWLLTKRPAFRALYQFWIKIFALSFGMGVVSGVVMSYEFGTNWSVFAAKVSPAIGPLLGFEVLTAFFLEASFLGVMLFGEKKVGPRLHFVATCIVAAGTVVSAFWILSANSWMQDPAGFVMDARGRFIATDWLQVIFSPTLPLRFAHMLLAAYLTTALVVGAASAWTLIREPKQAESRIALRMAIAMALIVAPLQLMVGDSAGKQVGEVQPSKLAAIEAFWDTKSHQPFNIVAWPDRAAQANRFAISIPDVGSWITHGSKDAVVTGLKAYAPADQPPVAVVFWAFRVMVALGLLMIVQGLWGAWLWWRATLETARLFLWFSTAMGPAGFIAVVAGWTTAEVGRQPYVVFGHLRTVDAVSPVGAGPISASLLAFVIIYALVFCVGVLYILRLIGQGPAPGAVADPPSAPRSPGSALAAAPNAFGDPSKEPRDDA